MSSDYISRGLWQRLTDAAQSLPYMWDVNYGDAIIKINITIKILCEYTEYRGYTSKLYHLEHQHII